MRKPYFIILIAVLGFIALNTIFNIKIYQRQVNFQTELLTQQIRICGNIIEKMGMDFENEVNFILFSDDITKLFYDPNIKEKGSKNLELFYSKYSGLINKVTIYDNEKNVYGLILDRKNNFVSDYYESQRQVPLQDRDRLYAENGKSLFTIPIFQNNKVHSNILIEIDFNRYLKSVFEQYELENAVWQWLVTEDGTVDTTFTNNLRIQSKQLERIGNDIFEGNEGSLLHSIDLDGNSMKVISVYYPVRLIRKDYGIVFSMKTDLFLQSIYLKTIIITLASLLLLALITIVFFRITSIQTRKAMDHAVSGQTLFNSINEIPAGLIITNSDNTIRFINKAALKLLLLDPENQYVGNNIDCLHLDRQFESIHPVYEKVFGKGYVVAVTKDKVERIMYTNDWCSQLGNDEVRYIMLYDVTYLEKSRRLDPVSHLTKSGLLDDMKQEIEVPLKNIRDALTRIGNGKSKESVAEEMDGIARSVDLLGTLVQADLDFCGLETDKALVEEIPFSLRKEVSLVIGSFSHADAKKNVSIITKIRDEIPDKLVGDPFRLKIVFKNLLENALQTTHEGRVLISAECIERKFGFFRIYFNIEDTGTGYSGDVIPKFYDAANHSDDYWKEQFGETGLRLAIAKQNIDLLRGSVEVESPSSISTNPEYPGTKCSFFVELTAHRELLEKRQNNKEIKHLSDIHCLVLNQENDPEEDSYRFIEELGITMFHRIYRNNNLGSLTEYLRERKSDIDILFIINKPGYEAHILLSELFEQNLSRYYYVIFASYIDLSDKNQHSEKYLVDLYLSQPFETNAIFEFIKDRFKDIPEEDFQNAPRGVRINVNTSILLAEYGLFNRKITRSMFKKLGFEIDIAENGIELLEKVKNKEFDILFMDLLMPDKDGIQTARELRKLGHKMPIIALTLVDPEKWKADTEAAGISDYLKKPVSVESIRRILFRLFPENA